MHCDFYQQQICTSCSQLHLSYQQTLTHKLGVLAELFPQMNILDFSGEEAAAGSRIRARLAVTGTLESPQTGFYDDQQRLVPVDQCPLHHPLINEWTSKLPEMIRSARLTPYDSGTDRGELKFVVLTSSPSHRQVMIQFVLRSREAVDRIRSLWRRMTDGEKQTLTVLSINLQPVRSSAIMGREEIPVSDQQYFPIRFGSRELVFGPQSFLQTNHQVATSLYETAAALIHESRAENVLDLYCGAGAFSLMASSTATKVLGIDVSANAIECAEEAARRNGLLNTEYQCRSLECTTADQLSGCEFDTIICNPPRRGLDAATVSLIQTIRPERVLYSSCNAKTLQRDVLALAGEYRVESLRPFDMFPFTTHFEVLALLVRK